MKKYKLSLRNPLPAPGTTPGMAKQDPNPNPSPRPRHLHELVLMAFLGLLMFGMYRTCENNHVEITGPVTIDCNLTGAASTFSGLKSR